MINFSGGNLMKRLLILTLILVVIPRVISAADDWTQKSPDPKPSARNNFGMAYVGGDNVLLFGGYDGTNSAQTWSYDLSSNTWTNKSPSTPYPTGRARHAMAYIGDDQVLMFGGNKGKDSLWVYDLSANTWTRQTLFFTPPPNDYLRMAYIGDDKVLLYGGDGTADTTWVYDLSANSWSYGKLGTTPDARYSHDMAYIGDDKVLLFGGRTSSNNDETWIYDLSDNTWTDMEDGQSWVSGTSKPSARMDHAMAYMGGDRVLLFGGFVSGGNNETWIYDLSDNTWTKDTNSGQPSSRYNHGMSATSLDGSSFIVLFGGTVAAVNDETWTFGGGDYSLPVELSSFSARADAGSLVLEWTTESETDNLGFILERKVSSHPELIEGWIEIASHLTHPELSGQGSVSHQSVYSYTDDSVEPGEVYDYRLADVSYTGDKEYYSLMLVGVGATSFVPDQFILEQNYPNPFNPVTSIRYGLPVHSEVRLEIFDLTGNLVSILVKDQQAVGWHYRQWGGTDLNGDLVGSGIYICRLTSGESLKTIRMVLLR